MADETSKKRACMRCHELSRPLLNVGSDFLPIFHSCSSFGTNPFIRHMYFKPSYNILVSFWKLIARHFAPRIPGGCDFERTKLEIFSHSDKRHCSHVGANHTLRHLLRLFFPPILNRMQLSFSYPRMLLILSSIR